MALQLSTAIRDAMLNQIEATIGTGAGAAVLEIRTGAAPANCAASDAGTVLATVDLPDDYFQAAASGVLALLGTWEDTSADDTGTAAHFRIYDDESTRVCHLQGTVGQGSGDLQVTNTSFAAGQPFTITAFSITAPNA